MDRFRSDSHTLFVALQHSSKKDFSPTIAVALERHVYLEGLLFHKQFGLLIPHLDNNMASTSWQDLADVCLRGSIQERSGNISDGAYSSRVRMVYSPLKKNPLQASA